MNDFLGKMAVFQKIFVILQPKGEQYESITENNPVVFQQVGTAVLVPAVGRRCRGVRHDAALLLGVQ